MLLVTGVIRMSTYYSLTGEDGIGSRILKMSSSDTGSKEDRVLLLVLGLVTETGIDDCSAALILSLKKCPKVLA